VTPSTLNLVHVIVWCTRGARVGNPRKVDTHDMMRQCQQDLRCHYKYIGWQLALRMCCLENVLPSSLACGLGAENLRAHVCRVEKCGLPSCFTQTTPNLLMPVHVGRFPKWQRERELLREKLANKVQTDTIHASVSICS